MPDAVKAKDADIGKDNHMSLVNSVKQNMLLFVCCVYPESVTHRGKET